MVVKSFICAVYIALAIAATSAQAIPMLETDGGYLITGVSNLKVNGVPYYATFSSGAFPINSSFKGPLYSLAFAGDATDALAAYLGSVLISPFDPKTFFGCNISYDFQPVEACHLVTAYSYAYPECLPNGDIDCWGYLPVEGASVNVDASGVTGITADYVTDNSDDYLTVGDVAWVTWSVPEPPVSILMASGLIVIGATKRKRKV